LDFVLGDPTRGVCFLLDYQKAEEAPRRSSASSRKRLTEGDVAMRKAVLLALVDHVIVDGKTIYLIGENDNISSAMAGKLGRRLAKKVRISIQEWCARGSRRKFVKYCKN
jgi:hypothetical protein